MLLHLRPGANPPVLITDPSVTFYVKKGTSTPNARRMGKAHPSTIQLGKMRLGYVTKTAAWNARA